MSRHTETRVFNLVPPSILNEKVRTVSAQLTIDPEKLLNYLSCSHCEQLVNLVFYNRILKCHVLIELKNDTFKHEHLGQLNSYVSYYKQHQMAKGDQPPIGILLCTRKNHEMVEFALAGMSNTLFVARYQVELPGKDEIVAFLHRTVEELGGGDE